MYCRMCGNEISENMSFCDKCGTPVVGSSELQAAIPEQPLQADADVSQSEKSAQDAVAVVQQQAQLEDADPKPQDSAQTDSICFSLDDYPSDFGVSGKHIPRGVKWTFKETIRGRNFPIVLVSLAILIILTILCGIPAGLFGEPTVEDVVSGGIRNVYAFIQVGEKLTYGLFFMVGIFLALGIAVLTIPVTLVLRAVMNARERKVDPGPLAQMIHASESRFKWNWFYSALIGLVLVVVLYLLLSNAFNFLCDWLVQTGVVPEFYETAVYFDSLLVVLALAVAELIMHRFARRKARRSRDSFVVSQRVARGFYDSELPERFRNQLDRGRIAAYLDNSVVSTVKGGVLLCRLLDLRIRVNRTSAFIGALLSSALSLFTFGSASLASSVDDTVIQSFADSSIAEDSRNSSKRRRKVAAPIVGIGTCIVIVALTAGLLVVDMRGVGNPKNHIESEARLIDSVVLDGQDVDLIYASVHNRSATHSYTVPYEVVFDKMDSNGNKVGEASLSPDSVSGIGVIRERFEWVSPGERRGCYMAFVNRQENGIKLDNPRIQQGDFIESRDVLEENGQCIAAEGDFTVRIGSYGLDENKSPVIKGVITNNMDQDVSRAIIGITCYSKKGVPQLFAYNDGSTVDFEAFDADVDSTIKSGESVEFIASINPEISEDITQRVANGGVYAFDLWGIRYYAA